MINKLKSYDLTDYLFVASFIAISFVNAILILSAF